MSNATTSKLSKTQQAAMDLLRSDGRQSIRTFNMQGVNASIATMRALKRMGLVVRVEGPGINDTDKHIPENRWERVWSPCDSCLITKECDTFQNEGRLVRESCGYKATA